jgi:uncharacterized delta-60 repeat protein
MIKSNLLAIQRVNVSRFVVRDEEYRPEPCARFESLEPRYLFSSNLDTAFGTGGIAEVGFAQGARADDVLRQHDGKLLIAGHPNGSFYGLARFNPDGSPDLSFSGDGIVDSIPNLPEQWSQWHMCQLADGRIILNGTVGMNGGALVCLKADGSLDTSFANGGIYLMEVSEVSSVLATADGGLLMGFSRLGNSRERSIVKLDASGKIDTAFAQQGRFTFSDGNVAQVANLTIGDDGCIYALRPVGAWYGEDVSHHAGFSVTKLTANGAIDTSYGQHGTVIVRPAELHFTCRGFTVAADGSIIVSGSVRKGLKYSHNLYVCKLTPAGTLDAGFGEGGLRVVEATGTLLDVEPLADGSIVATIGWRGSDGSGPELLRFDATGRITERLETTLTEAVATALDGDNGLIVVGMQGEPNTRTIAVARFNLEVIIPSPEEPAESDEPADDEPTAPSIVLPGIDGITLDFADEPTADEPLSPLDDQDDLLLPPDSADLLPAAR